MAQPASSEPEMEVPSVAEERNERRDEELIDEKQGCISPTHIEIHETEQQKCEIEAPHEGDGFNGLTTTEGITFGDFDFGSQLTWSDEENSEGEGFGLSFYDSILAIRKEASMINAVMAIDQLDTLKDEIRSMRRELGDRSAEIDELHSLIQLKDDRIGTLELERDLYKADTSKLANDLESCLLKLRLISTAPDTVCDLLNQSLIFTDEPSKDREPNQFSNGVPSLATQTMRLDPPSCINSSQTTTSRTTATASTISVSVISPESIPVFEKPRISAGSKRANRVESRPRRTNGRAFTLCRSASQKQVMVSESLPTEPEPRGILQEQIQEMSQRLKGSVETSEELRRRLAKISRYYESLVRHLHDSLIEVTTDRAHMKFDFTRQISTMDREHKSTLAEIESKMREPGDSESIESSVSSHLNRYE